MDWRTLSCRPALNHLITLCCIFESPQKVAHNIMKLTTSTSVPESLERLQDSWGSSRSNWAFARMAWVGSCARAASVPWLIMLFKIRLNTFLPIFQNFCSSLRSDIAAGSVSAGFAAAKRGASGTPAASARRRCGARSDCGRAAALVDGRPVARWARRICSGRLQSGAKISQCQVVSICRFSGNGQKWRSMGIRVHNNQGNKKAREARMFVFKCSSSCPKRVKRQLSLVSGFRTLKWIQMIHGCMGCNSFKEKTCFWKWHNYFLFDVHIFGKPRVRRPQATCRERLCVGGLLSGSGGCHTDGLETQISMV